MGWTPALGTRTLVHRVGEENTITVLSRLLAGEIPSVDQTVPPYRQVLLDIGNGHAERLLSDDSGQRLVYWPKVWAARSLAYVGR
ncbi:MAG: hypothetical protein U9R47_01540, partial [Actinomycetota bacterium]|nr:hypothetical protein [Actinomycetota bacterium]